MEQVDLVQKSLATRAADDEHGAAKLDGRVALPRQRQRRITASRSVRVLIRLEFPLERREQELCDIVILPLPRRATVDHQRVTNLHRSVIAPVRGRRATRLICVCEWTHAHRIGVNHERGASGLLAAGATEEDQPLASPDRRERRRGARRRAAVEQRNDGMRPRVPWEREQREIIQISAGGVAAGGEFRIEAAIDEEGRIVRIAAPPHRRAVPDARARRLADCLRTAPARRLLLRVENPEFIGGDAWRARAVCGRFFIGPNLLAEPAENQHRPAIRCGHVQAERWRRVAARVWTAPLPARRGALGRIVELGEDYELVRDATRGHPSVDPHVRANRSGAVALASRAWTLRRRIFRGNDRLPEHWWAFNCRCSLLTRAQTLLQRRALAKAGSQAQELYGGMD